MSRRKKAEETSAEVETLEAVEEPTEEVAEAEETQPEEQETAEPVVYIGPDIRHIAVSGTVYGNGLPVKLSQKVEEIPALKGLIVPVSKLAESLTLRNTRGTALFNLYRTAKEKL